MSDVLAIAEHRQGEMRDVSHELITAGEALTESTDGELHVGVINGDVDAFADELNRGGVDTIHTVAAGEEFNHDVYTQAVTQLFDELDPQVVLVPHTANGMDYAPAVANTLGLPVITDAIDLQNNGQLDVTREMYNSKVESVLTSESDRAIVTVRPGEWSVPETDGDATVSEFDGTIDESAVTTTVSEFQEVVDSDIDISGSDFIVSIGRGIEDEENIELIEELCDATGATLAASRPVCDNQWLPKSRQVGQSGNEVQPEVYIAIGISGAVQHVAGMKNSETIIAINNDPSAPIFDIADYGIADDLFDVVPELIDYFE
jgi:electron transfer flavoprotein alpha subunit